MTPEQARYVGVVYALVLLLAFVLFDPPTRPPGAAPVVA